jgi:hypothetical protein
MKVCYVHLGIHKTGSTSLQQWLVTNEGRLRAMNVLVPLAGRAAPHIAAHHHLAFDLNGDPQLDRAKGGLDELVAELKNSPFSNAVISSEDLSFSALHPPRLNRLVESLNQAGYRPFWIVYLRPAAGWLDSAYAEMSKALLVRRRLEQWLDQAGHRTLVYQLAKLMSSLSMTGHPVKLRSFALACRRGLAADFLDCLDVPEDAAIWSQLPNINERPQVLWVEYFRLLARFLAANDLQLRRPEFVGRSRAALRLLPKSPPFVGMTATLAAAVNAQTRQDHEEALRLGGYAGAFEEFFPAETFVPTEYRQDKAPPRDRRAIRDALLRTLLTRSS